MPGTFKGAVGKPYPSLERQVLELRKHSLDSTETLEEAGLK